MTQAERIKDRFWSKVIKSNQCWIWHTRPKKYGFFSINGKVMNASRASYLLNIGLVGKLDVCHKCNNKACVRPDHLYLGTRSQNMKDASRDGLMDLVKNRYKNQLFCKRGHDYKIFARVKKDGRRECKECSRIRVRAYRESQR